MTSTTAPAAIDTDAPVIARHRLLIAAPRATIWDIHADADRWPEWQTDISAASIDGPFAAGNTITWSTAGIDEPIPSAISVVEPQRRTVWGAPAMGIVGIHEWRFIDAEGGTIVETEESWSGAPVEADPGKMQALLDASLERWLDLLKKRATA